MAPQNLTIHETATALIVAHIEITRQQLIIFLIVMIPMASYGSYKLFMYLFNCMSQWKNCNHGYRGVVTNDTKMTVPPYLLRERRRWLKSDVPKSAVSAMPLLEVDEEYCDVAVEEKLE